MNNYEELIQNSEKAILVDFYASWCAPCKSLSPILDELQKEYADRMEIVKIDVDENFQMAEKYCIQTVPTLMVFKNGNPIHTMRGFLPKVKITEMINSSI